MDESCMVEGGDCTYLLVVVDDVSGYVWLEPAAKCTADVAARAIVKWSVLFGAPRVLVSDTARHFQNQLLKMLRGSAG